MNYYFFVEFLIRSEGEKAMLVHSVVVIVILYEIETLKKWEHYWIGDTRAGYLHFRVVVTAGSASIGIR